MWEAANGPIPKGYYIDHIDGNPLNDALDNLRLALPKENSWNMKTPKSNTSGLKGLSWSKEREMWRGTVTDCCNSLSILPTWKPSQTA